MKSILITGGMGSGKSEVCRYLSSKGYPVYDSDSRCKALYESVPGLKSRVEKAIGVPFSEVKVIFRDSSKREALEAVVYPEVRKDFLEWKAAQDSGIVFFESAVASGKKEFEDCFDETLLVTSPEYQRIQRAVKRDSATRKEVIERISQQNPFIPYTYRIPNNGTVEELHRRIDAFLNTIENIK